MSKIAMLGCLLFAAFSSSTLCRAEEVKTFSISKGDSAVRALDQCGDGGTCFAVNLSVPSGTITSINYSCQGKVCPWVHPCPDNGKCGAHSREYVVNGPNAEWYGWTNSGDRDAVYTFQIHYEPQ